MDDHVGKPINPAQLLETLSRWSSANGATADEPADARALVG